MTPRTRFTATLLAILAFALSVGVAPAGAHGGEGEIAVEARSPQAAGVRYVVRLIWTDDGHAALDATVTATAIDAAGAPQTPVTFNALDQDGRYAAVVPAPAGGAYTVRFTAVTPEATTEITQQPPPPPTTTTEPAPPATASQAPTTTATDDDEITDAPEGDDDAEGDSGGASVFFVFVTVAAVALIAVPIVLQRRRRTP